MNRIRKYNNKFQVLITPTNRFDPSFEKIMGGWTDEHLRNYSIKEYDTLNEAICQAFKYPDIDWTKMIINHKDLYYDLKDNIQSIINRERFNVNFEPILMNPDDAKNIFFDRVNNLGNRFSIVNNFNDIINFNISNPYTNNLNELVLKLIKEPSLRIFKKITTSNVIQLVGKTFIGTTYEINLWTDILYNWHKWYLLNKNNINEIQKNNSLNKAFELQNKIDSDFSLR